MENRRIVRGNFTTLPTGADVLSAGATNAVTERKNEDEPRREPHPSGRSVREARRFSQQHQT